MENSLSEIQTAVNELLNVKSLIRKKKKTYAEKKKELFISVVNSIEQIITRQDLMYADFNLDLAKYDEAFLDVIDSLIILNFGKEGAELISFYLWDRLSPDGEINPLFDTEGREIYIETAEDLWNLLKLVISPDGQE
jgi:hypothetical protein